MSHEEIQRALRAFERDGIVWSWDSEVEDDEDTPPTRVYYIWITGEGIERYTRREAARLITGRLAYAC